MEIDGSITTIGPSFSLTFILVFYKEGAEHITRKEIKKHKKRTPVREVEGGSERASHPAGGNAAKSQSAIREG